MDESEPLSKGKRLPRKKINRIAKKYASVKPLIVTGSTALNIQLPRRLRRQAHDVDLWSKNPSFHMDHFEDILDEHAGGDRYKERVISMDDALSVSGHKQIYQVVDNVTGKSVVDFSERTPRARTIQLNKLRYEHIQHIKKKFNAILEDPRTTPARKKKVQSDLKRIEKYERSKK